MLRYQSVNNSSPRLRFNCYKPGHTTINYRFKKNENFKVFSHHHNIKFCRYCKKSGHLIECRKREYNSKNHPQIENQNPKYTNHAPYSSPIRPNQNNHLNL